MLLSDASYTFNRPHRKASSRVRCGFALVSPQSVVVQRRESAICAAPKPLADPLPTSCRKESEQGSPPSRTAPAASSALAAALERVDKARFESGRGAATFLARPMFQGAGLGRATFWGKAFEGRTFWGKDTWRLR